MEIQAEDYHNEVHSLLGMPGVGNGVVDMEKAERGLAKLAQDVRQMWIMVDRGELEKARGIYKLWLPHELELSNGPKRNQGIEDGEAQYYQMAARIGVLGLVRNYAVLMAKVARRSMWSRLLHGGGDYMVARYDKEVERWYGVMDGIYYSAGLERPIPMTIHGGPINWDLERVQDRVNFLRLCGRQAEARRMLEKVVKNVREPDGDKMMGVDIPDASQSIIGRVRRVMDDPDLKEAYEGLGTGQAYSVLCLRMAQFGGDKEWYERAWKTARGMEGNPDRVRSIGSQVVRGLVIRGDLRSAGRVWREMGRS